MRGIELGGKGERTARRVTVKGREKPRQSPSSLPAPDNQFLIVLRSILVDTPFRTVLRRLLRVPDEHDLLRGHDEDTPNPDEPTRPAPGTASVAALPQG